jgi:peroxiredoxin
MTPGMAGYRVARLAALLIGFLSLPLVAAAARRDAATRALDAVQSRPHQAHELLLARWLGSLGAMLAMLAVLAVCAFGAQVLAARGLVADAGPRFSPLAMLDALVVGALPLVFLSALAYCLVEILQNALASALIAVYWLMVMLGRDYVARVFDFSLPQNAGVYLLLAAGAVLTAMTVARLRQGLEHSRTLKLPAAALLCLLAGVLLAWHFVRTRHDPPLHADQVTQAVASQSILTGRLPGFWLPDQHGKMVRLADYAGKPLVVGFWSPAAPESVKLLAGLERLTAKWAPQGVHVVGVCLANDRSLGGRFAREQRCSFPVVTDDGTHWAEALVDASPLAEAYDVSDLPSVFVADGDRNLVLRVGGGGSAEGLADTALRGLLPAP